ncbi:hypothetical protein VB10N_29080 [Vibrio sp. 10N]|nr:hypothetical protein VB10N_29080 [Vibrio sp. 10N]
MVICSVDVISTLPTLVPELDPVDVQPIRAALINTQISFLFDNITDLKPSILVSIISIFYTFYGRSMSKEQP